MGSWPRHVVYARRVHSFVVGSRADRHCDPCDPRPKCMNIDARKLVAVVLIVLGALGLAYGGFSYTSDTHRADIGPVHMQVNEKEHVNVPVWAGVADRKSTRLNYSH